MMSEFDPHDAGLQAYLDILGCTCDEVEVALREIEPGLSHAVIGHDDGCPAAMKTKRASN
jgi:hypothetical protein